MKTLILLAFMLSANVFAGGWQETFCGDKSLSYCINHFDRQCDAKKYCWVVGALHYEQEQYSKAKKYYEMVCDKANSNSKDSYEMELIDGRVVELPVIIDMQASCAMLGMFYQNGLGVRQSDEKALQYDKKACDLGNSESCVFVAVAYYDGKVVKKDLKSAIKFTAKACELKSDMGCGSLGQIYQYGIGVKQNLSRAKELLGKSCDLGEQMGCDEYKKLKENGY